MKWLAITLVLSGCTNNLDGDLRADNLDLLMLECWGFCRVSQGESDGEIIIDRELNRKATP